MKAAFICPLYDMKNHFDLALKLYQSKLEYKIKEDNTYNYIDLLLYNIKFKCYVVIKLKITELKKEHTGQIQIYKNIDNC